MERISPCLLWKRRPVPPWSAGRLAGLQYYLAIAEENLRMAKGFWKPTVALVGNYAESQSKSPGLSDPTLTVTLGLEASLFSGGGKLAEVREKEAALEKGNTTTGRRWKGSNWR